MLLPVRKLVYLKLRNVAVLYLIVKDASDWTWTLVECFIDDSLHERYWVDRLCAGALVDNIVTAFGTTAPTEDLYTACELTYPERFQHRKVHFLSIVSLLRHILSHNSLQRSCTVINSAKNRSF